MTEFVKGFLADASATDEDVDPAPFADITWANEDAFWREQYSTRTYAIADRGYSFYQAAYRYGVESCIKQRGIIWDDHVESNLERGWSRARGDCIATWEQARPAVRDAWERACGGGLASAPLVMQ